MAQTPYTRYIDTHYDAYDETSWNCGDTVTAEKMNKIENQLSVLGGGTLIIDTVYHYDEGTLTLNKTAREIIEAVQSGIQPIVHAIFEIANDEDFEDIYETQIMFQPLTQINIDGTLQSIGTHGITFYFSPQSFIAFALDEYPYYQV